MKSNALSPLLVIVGILLALLLILPYLGVNFLGTPEETYLANSPRDEGVLHHADKNDRGSESDSEDIRRLLGE